jgi:hypothetical protein
MTSCVVYRDSPAGCVDAPLGFSCLGLEFLRPRHAENTYATTAPLCNVNSAMGLLALFLQKDIM